MQMKAMVLREFGAPLHLENVRKPTPGPGEVVVRVRACGICYTDLKIINGVLPRRPALPHILGHEPAGEVAELGAGVEGLQVGDRVAVYFYATCKNCFFCRNGLETSCERLAGQIGFTVNGAYAEYLTVPADNVAKLADHVPFAHGAVVADAIATTLQGLRDRARVQLGETVLVVGAGGLGLHAIQVARLAGATVFAMDQASAKLDLALQLGADRAFESAGADVVARILDETGGRGVDVAVDLVGIPETGETCIKCLRSGGRMILLGYRPGLDLPLPPTEIVVRQLSIMGSRASNLGTFRDAVALVNDGRLKPVVTDHFALEDANDALDRLQRNSFLGRAVLELD